MDSSDEDGLSTDAVHVDAGASLNIIEVYVAKLGDEVDHIILGTHLEQREGRRGRELGRKEEREREERKKGEGEGGRKRESGGRRGGGRRKQQKEKRERKERETIEEKEREGR